MRGIFPSPKSLQLTLSANEIRLTFMGLQGCENL